MAQGERLTQASVRGVIRRAVRGNAAVKSSDLANGRISVCVHMHLGGTWQGGFGRCVWQTGFGHAGRGWGCVPMPAALQSCSQLCTCGMQYGDAMEGS